jgi:peptide/nickel transport system ATP-binding protein/oligopeptide transport system ATP-binding protein
VEPPLAEYAGGHLAACHHPLTVSQAEISAAVRSPLSPLSAGQPMPGGSEGTAPETQLPGVSR